MTGLVVATPEGVLLRYEIAGAGSRLAAGIADGVLIVAAYLFTVLGVLIATQFDVSGASGFVIGLLLGGAVMVVVGYHVVFHLRWEGQTPGKRWLGVAVMSADGYPASPLQILIRALVWPIDIFIAVPAPIGLIAIAATERHQRLGDLAAGTLVVRVPRTGGHYEPWSGIRWSDLENPSLRLTPGLAARLSTDDLDFLRALLTRTELDGEAKRKLFIDTARMYAQRLDLGEFEDARVVLREVYLFTREMLALRAG